MQFSTRTRHRWSRPAVVRGLLLTLLALSGCSRGIQPTPELAGPDCVSVDCRLRAEIDQWIGVPHRLGGASRAGLDCSAFTSGLYRRLFGIHIPRTTDRQRLIGMAVPCSRLQAGDLLFFETPAGKRHVGIYLSRGEFAHVSTSQGVTISRIDAAYWHETFQTARRLAEITAPPAF